METRKQSFDERLELRGIAKYLFELGIERTNTLMEAGIGITFAEWGVAETGTFTVYNRPKKPRSVSLVSNAYLVFINEDSIIPTMDYVLADMSKMASIGDLPSCIQSL